MEEFSLKQFNISDGMFISKLKSDLGQGVQIDSSNFEHTRLTKVWTDTKEWQFVIIGLSESNDLESLTACEIQSTGQSKMFFRMKAIIKDGVVTSKFQKLGQSFAQTELVEPAEAQEFIEAYIESTFNRTLTGELFEELAHDKNYFSWLSY